ncbi:hypothetical protein RRG08_002724 [Elysia crispata]|uniref:Uncharacterized protein n=1 Tax=Elysia crispata TaxID=231223 RepID=A0AAE0XU12_9GAST|nr:hypothetical protein RRG08_002724 [Elysia crispata]
MHQSELVNHPTISPRDPCTNHRVSQPSNHLAKRSMHLSQKLFGIFPERLQVNIWDWMIKERGAERGRALFPATRDSRVGPLSGTGSDDTMGQEKLCHETWSRLLEKPTQLITELPPVMTETWSD